MLTPSDSHRERISRSLAPGVPASAGRVAFAGSIDSSALDIADLAILGLPMEQAGPLRTGTGFGPTELRLASHTITAAETDVASAVVSGPRVVDLGDAPDSAEETEHLLGSLLDMGICPIALGGSQALTWSILQPIANRYGPVGLVVFDAHLPEPTATRSQPDGHAFALSAAIQAGLVNPGRTVYVGWRAGGLEGSAIEAFRALGARSLSTEQVLTDGVAQVREAIAALAPGPLHISLDLDVVDPAFAPGVTVPVPRGLTGREVLAIIRDLRGVPCTSFSIMELCPPFDHNQITSTLAANLVYQFISTRVLLTPSMNQRTSAPALVVTS